MSVTHCAGNGLSAPFNLSLLIFVMRFLLHGTGPGEGLPRLTHKGLVWPLKAVDFEALLCVLHQASCVKQFREVRLYDC
jgi:hypothetical protein